VGGGPPGVRVGLLHGRMKGADKEEAMAAFSRGEIQVLVSTTVVEVGVDVPNATVMVIEHAERFGLAQLHQLRGRVGRGRASSTCVLLAYGRLSEVARARLDVMVSTRTASRSRRGTSSSAARGTSSAPASGDADLPGGPPRPRPRPPRAGPDGGVPARGRGRAALPLAGSWTRAVERRFGLARVG